MKNRKIVLSLMIVILLSFSGCIIGDSDYATAKYQYSMGWILHNINSSTSTNITYSQSELAVYNYSYDYPADIPNNFINYFAYLAPVPRNLTEETLVFGNIIAVPLNRTYYVRGPPPPSENYKTNWSFFNEMDINYMTVPQTHFEEYNSSGYRSISPVPGSSISVSFGKSPYTPASLSVDNKSVRLSGYLMRGYIPLAWLWRDAANSNTGAVPIYSIYLNGGLVYAGNLTDSYAIWNHTVFNYSFAGNGTYFVNFTIPSDYPVWNLTTVESKFTIPNIDVQPPMLNHVEANPYFQYEVPYSIGINATDDSGIKNISVYYFENSGWIQLDMYNYSGIFKSNLTITNTSVNSFDLKISINDIYDNQINYTIQPIALLGKNVSLSIGFNTNSTIEGGIASVEGTVESNGISLNGFLVEILLNDIDVGNALVGYSGYSTNIRLPCGLSYSNITARFAGTGIYIPNETFNYTGLSFIPLNFSVNDTLPLNTFSVINSSGGGARININSSSWSYSGYMNNNYFNFAPRHYGNYTIILNTSCGENSSKTIFADIKLPPQIIGIDYSPQSYPLSGRDFDMYISTLSDDIKDLTGNLSNSTTNSTMNFAFSSDINKDPYTLEPYNDTYCYDCWVTNMNELPAGVYNVSMEVSDTKGQKGFMNDTIYVYPEINITFNISDYNGNPLKRDVYIGQYPYYYTWYYNINGSQEIDMLPNFSYFNKTFDLTIINQTGFDSSTINLFNSTIFGNISMESDYIENKTEFQDKIIYAAYFFNTSWSYAQLSAELIYSNTSRFAMHNTNRSSIYACKSYNIIQHQCVGEWVNMTSYKYAYGPYVELDGSIDDPQAIGFGESLSCGDGYCSTYENCSTCQADCGQCQQNQNNQQNNNNQVNNPGGTGNFTFKPSCSESWTCTDWSQCNDSIQTRTCTDTNYCGTNENKPSDSQSCTIPIVQTTENIPISQAASCDFDCCFNETVYVDKLCNSSSDCVNHTCVPKETKTEDNFLLYVGIGITAAIIVSFVFIYFKFLKGRFILPLKQEKLYNEINNLTNEVSTLKLNHDTTALESELILARNALSKGLKETAAVHIENVKKLKKSIS